MEQLTLEATKRTETGTRAAQALRARGVTPAVLYGRQRDTVHLSIDSREFERLFHDGARLLQLEIGGIVEPALIKDLQYDALGDHILHVDFARIDMHEKVEVTVPVQLHGTPKGVEEGGVLDHLLMDVEVSCLPTDMPDHIRVEVAHLEIGDVIHIRDLEAPEGVEFLDDEETPVVTVSPPQELEEPETAEEAVFTMEAEPEVIGREKEEEEEAPPEGEED
jgi:large subunit ribosomal protein L25